MNEGARYDATGRPLDLDRHRRLDTSGLTPMVSFDVSVSPLMLDGQSYFNPRLDRI